MSYTPKNTIYLCLAHMSENKMEEKYVKEAFDTNWVVPLGPNVNGFEEDLKTFVSPQPLKGSVLKSADPVYYEELKKRAQENRNNPTEAEELMWTILSNKKLDGFKFRRQHIIGQYIVDFVCLDKMLVIELDGGYHDDPVQQQDDKVRTEWLNKQGFRVIRFKNEELFAQTDKVLETILTNLKPQPLNPLKGTSGYEVVALSAGTAAVHLGLLACGVGRGDEVIVQSFTFCASSHPITYLGAKPVFVGSEPETWNMDPVLLERAIEDRIKRTGRKPKAIVPVALYGMPYDCERIMAIADRYGIPVVEDAAEGFGSRFDGRVLGTFGRFGVLSFNGNKMITTSGGGALICRDAEDKQTIMWYATQARDAYPYYEHTAIGYNYRMSNVCAGIGRGQMTIVNEHIAHHKYVQSLYENLLKDVPGVHIHKQPADGRYDSNFWLCTATIDPEVKVVGQENAYKEVVKTAVGGAAGVIRSVECATTDCQPNENVEALRVFMLSRKVECRPVWKPMHCQPVYKAGEIQKYRISEIQNLRNTEIQNLRNTEGGEIDVIEYANSVAYTKHVEEDIFKVGFCLPAGPWVTEEDVKYIVQCIKDALNK